MWAMNHEIHETHENGDAATRSRLKRKEGGEK